MHLYLLRHAEATAYQADDFSRKLTMKGMAQAERVGEFLLKHELKPDLILTSPVLRAKETAEIISKKLGNHSLIVASWIACGMRPDVALSELSDYKKFNSVMIVGHEPDFSSLIATLIGMESSEHINISKASLTAINLARFAPGSGVLRFLFPDKLL